MPFDGSLGSQLPLAERAVPFDVKRHVQDLYMTSGTYLSNRRKIEAHSFSKFPPEVVIEVGQIRGIYRDEPDVIVAILGHLPAHCPDVVVPCSRVR